MTRKMHGKEISDAQVDAWVAEAEDGYDVEELEEADHRTPRTRP
jgi:predicted transcriptional regulator